MEAESITYMFAARVLLKGATLFVKVGQKEEMMETHMLGDDWFLSRVSLKKNSMDRYADQLQFGYMLSSKQNGRKVNVSYNKFNLKMTGKDTLVIVDVDSVPVYKDFPDVWRDDRTVVTALKQINGMPVDVALGTKVVFGSRAICLLDPLLAFYLRRHSKFQCIPTVSLSEKFVQYAEHFIEIMEDAKIKEEEERKEAKEKSIKKPKKGFFRRIRNFSCLRSSRY